MIRSLKAVSLRLWLLALAALPACFAVLPWAGRLFPDLPVLAGAAALILGMACLLGVGLDLLGRLRIRGLIREGQLWERAGILNRAEKRFSAACTVYNSFLVSSWSARRLRPLLINALARFYLGSGSRHPGFARAAALYLAANPGDKDLAGLWLERFTARAETRCRSTDGLDQAVLTALADHHFSDPGLSVRLTRIFLEIGRSDYTARRLYKSYLEIWGEDPHGLAPRIERLVGPVEHFDAPVANDGPVSMGQKMPAPDILDLATGSLADRRPGMPGPGHGRRHGRKGLGPAARSVRQAILTAGRRILGLARALAGAVQSVPSVLAGLARGLVLGLGEKKWAVTLIKAALAGGLGIWLVFFTWSTVVHILDKTSQEKEAVRVAVQVPQPFTIQVAAYLKPAHAKGFVEQLAAQGVAAEIKETRGGGKTWYLVRVSRFPTKTEAAAFGRDLKARQVIQDFFVSNH